MLWFGDAEAFVRATASPAFDAALAALRDAGQERYLHRLAVQENWIIRH